MGRAEGLCSGGPARCSGLGQQCGVDSGDAEEDVSVHWSCLEPSAVMHACVPCTAESKADDCDSQPTLGSKGRPWAT